MRVCIVSLGSLPVIAREYKAGRIGGAEVQLAQLALALARQGHDVSMIVEDHGQANPSTYGRIRLHSAFDPAAGVPLIRFLHPRCTGLWRAASEADAEVYLCSTASMIVGLLALFCRLNGRRLVFRVASDSDCEPSQLLIEYRRDRWLYQYGIRRADAVLVQSRWQLDAIRRNFGREGTLIRGLIDWPVPAGSGQAKKDIDVLWVANLRQLKRPDKFLELVRMLPHVRFCMAGGRSPGEEALYEEIQKEAGTVSNMEFRGAVPYLDVGDLFDRARLFANTSDVEGFPNTFLQAWVRGIPVVTSFDPDGVVQSNGLGAARTNVEGMAESIELLLTREDAYRALSSAATQYVESNFAEAEILRPYLRALSTH
ncbi:MAG: glycosyltransferase family 4 protein [Gammaproteobacteria bacterium]|nr:glycosyltransferase family 4 protein [Ideonella sp.]MCC6715355.1 glycosyltransferase family 4 protein [Gammaproteobacteria bacterium]